MRCLSYDVLAGLLGILLCSQSGCFTLSSIIRKESSELDTRLLNAQGYSIPPGGMPTKVSSKGSEKPSVVLEIRSDKNKRHVERIPLPMDQGVFVQDIVQQAKLHSKLGPLRVSIMRPSGPMSPPVRLEARTDKHGKTSSLGKNYALLPGDHIIVNEDKRSTLEKLMDAS